MDSVPEPESIPEHECMVSMPSVSYADWLSPAMPRSLSSFTARLRASLRPTPAARRARRRPLVRGQPPGALPCSAPGQIVESPETGFTYAVDRLLGEGGFGQVYLARRLGRSRDVPEILCIKVSTRIDGWLREAYFGQLLDEHPRAIRIFDAFPLLAPADAGPLLPGARVRALRRPERVSAPARRAAGRSGPRAARSPASSKCSASCTAASCCIAT